MCSIESGSLMLPAYGEQPSGADSDYEDGAPGAPPVQAVLHRGSPRPTRELEALIVESAQNHDNRR
jgi:hypothetical protein